MSPFDYTAGQVFFRDSFVPFASANVSIVSSPVLYGLSVYTVFSVNWNEAEKKHYAFRLKDHYKRLVNSAAIMDFNNFASAWPYEKFEATMRELIKRNAIQEESVLVRATIFVDALIAGTKIHDLPHSFAAYVYPMGQILPRGGVNLCVSSWTRNVDNAIPSRAKVNGGYVNSALIKNEALLNGYDDAIALDARGHVTEGTVSNIFIVRDGILITPAVSEDLLEGITRASILTIARDAGLQVQERTLDRTELYIADEAFLCGSSAHVVPILSVDKRPIKSGADGPITKMILEKFKTTQVGKDEGKYREWRTEI
jgi:branched-chain amino acid aminotransferase